MNTDGKKLQDENFGRAGDPNGLSLLQKRPNIVLCGAYGRGNVGDDAIMQVITADLRAAFPEAELTVISRHPEVTRKLCSVRTVHMLNMIGLYRLFRRTCLYISGGGSLIADNTSTRSLRYYLMSIRAAKRGGAAVMLYGCGIGPFGSERNRRHAAKVLNACADVIATRDGESAEELRSMGVTVPRLLTAADPTLTLKPDRWLASPALADIGFTAGKYFCVALRSWDGIEPALPAVAAACEKIYSAHGLTPLLIPMQQPTDEAIGARLRSMLHCPCGMLTGFRSADTVLSVIAGSRLVLGMRLHSLIFAASAGVPFVGISYDVKVARFARSVGNMRCIEMNELCEESLLDAAESVIGKTPDAGALVALAGINTDEAKKLICKK